ncbi:MAG TPA: GTP 3',8-cyclase MoaA [Anaerolineae bacterium]
MSLLRGDEDVRIVGREKDMDKAIVLVRTLKPDVIIVDSKDSEASRELAMNCVLKEGLQPRIVGLNVQDNKVFVCQSEQGHIENLADFLQTIKTDHAAPHSFEPHASEISPLRDRYGRTLDYLRVSVTDRCNLRCVYCMPPEGIPYKPRDTILHSEEVVRMVEAAAGVGVRTVRLTGGEPLVRKNIAGLVRRLAAIPGIDQVAMTTNATLLSTHAKDLADAGLTRVNISLDSLRPERFRRITRQGSLETVWQGIHAAEAAGLTPLKINMVVVRGFNDDEVVDFARLTLQHPWHVRFIEVMPVAGAADWGTDMPAIGERLITAAEIRKRIQVVGALSVDPGPRGNGPARYYRLPNALGTLGFISPISEHFCKSCNRMRLTADGYLRPCLFSEAGVYCKTALSDGASLSELQMLIRQAGDLKPEQRSEIASDPVNGTAMSMIGG